jgi:hypothetical protein
MTRNANPQQPLFGVRLKFRAGGVEGGKPERRGIDGDDLRKSVKRRA